MANWWNNLQTGFGDALIGINNPFGLAPPEGYDRQAAMRSGALNLGVNMLANANASPLEAIGRGYSQAQEQAGRQQMQSMAAQEMMARAEENRRKREEEQKRNQWMEQQIAQLPADQQALARMMPDKYFGNMLDAQFQTAEPREPKRYNVGGTLVDENGNVIFQPEPGQAAQNMNPTELKAVFAAEDELPALQGTKEALQRAKDLNDKTYTGMGAGAAGYIGSKVPGGSMLFDEQTAKNTVEWQSIMSLESISMMADSLKGATTNFELNEFKRILADPSTPADIRKRTLERMATLADRKEKMLQGRLNMLKGGQGSAPAGDPLQAARDAIARGADPEAVRQRLMENGYDPSGL